MPEPLDDTIRARMRSQGRRDTKPELAIRRGLHALGHRFRVDHSPEPDLRCRGDIVFTRKQVVVFVDGCFWHGCPDHSTEPKNNSAWWREKLAANRSRDARNTIALEQRGWLVLRFWEHVDPADAVRAVAETLADR